MIRSMRRRKTVTAATLHYFTNQISKRRIVAGPDPLHHLLNKMCTDIIAKNECNKKEKTPHQTCFFVSCPHPHQ